MFAVESGRGVVAIQTGLSPKVIRVPTTDQWLHGEEVEVIIQRPTGEDDYVKIEGHSIDD